MIMQASEKVRQRSLYLLVLLPRGKFEAARGGSTMFHDGREAAASSGSPPPSRCAISRTAGLFRLRADLKLGTKDSIRSMNLSKGGNMNGKIHLTPLVQRTCERMCPERVLYS